MIFSTHTSGNFLYGSRFRDTAGIKSERNKRVSFGGQVHSFAKEGLVTPGIALIASALTSAAGIKQIATNNSKAKSDLNFDETLELLKRNISANKIEVISDDKTGEKYIRLNCNLSLENLMKDELLNEKNLNIFDYIKAVNGNLKFGNTENVRLGNLEVIGGDADFSGAKIGKFGKVKRIGGNANFENAEIRTFGSLEEIGGNANFTGAKIHSLGALRIIGSNVEIKPGQFSKKYGYAYFKNAEIGDFGNLEEIKGDAFFQNAKMPSLGECTIVNDITQQAKIVSSGKLKKIGGLLRGYEEYPLLHADFVQKPHEEVQPEAKKEPEIKFLEIKPKKHSQPVQKPETVLQQQVHDNKTGSGASATPILLRNSVERSFSPISRSIKNDEAVKRSEFETISQDGFNLQSAVRNKLTETLLQSPESNNKTTVQNQNNIRNGIYHKEYQKMNFDKALLLLSYVAIDYEEIVDKKTGEKFIKIKGDFNFDDFQTLIPETDRQHSEDIFKFIKVIEGDANFSGIELKSLGKLEIINGNAYFKGAVIESLGELRKIGGNAYFVGSKIGKFDKKEDNTAGIVKSLGRIEEIDGDVHFISEDIKSLNPLRKIGGNLYFSYSVCNSCKSLEQIGGYQAVPTINDNIREFLESVCKNKKGRN